MDSGSRALASPQGSQQTLNTVPFSQDQDHKLPQAPLLDLPRMVALPDTNGTSSTSATGSENLSSVYRHRNNVSSLVSSPDPSSVTTVTDILRRSARLYPLAHAIGARPLLKIEKEMRDVPAVNSSAAPRRKEWTVYVLGKYYWMSYCEFYAAALLLGTVLERTLNVSKGALATIYSKTCPEWQIAAQACASRGLVITTCYESLGLDGLKHSLNETAASVAFVHPDLVPNILKIAPDCPNLKNIVLLSPYVCQYNAKIGRASSTELPSEYVELEIAANASEMIRKDASSLSVYILYDLLPPAQVQRLAINVDTLVASQSAAPAASPTAVSTTEKKTESKPKETEISGEETGEKEQLSSPSTSLKNDSEEQDQEKKEQASADNFPEILPPIAQLPSDMLCVMYTSGSTGTPKGVILSHGNIVGAIGGMLSVIPGILRPTLDVYLAFLPLAHVMEFVVECLSYFVGCALGYGHPRTLTSLSVRDCNSDIQELAPTYMAGVPQVWEATQKRISSEVAKAPRAARAIFRASSSLKVWGFNNKTSWLTNTIDRTIMRRVRNLTGGRLRFCLSGGAPLAFPVQQFLTGTLCPVIQGYGMTETCGGGALYNFGLPLIPGSSGPPIGAVELRLGPVEGAPQYNPLSKECPSGELMLRGTCVFQGYYKRPDLTAEVLSSDGWFRTGDVAAVDPISGTISIIDRAKNLVKLANGEYIALEKLESAYATTPVVARVCVVANSHWNMVLAVVQPNPAILCSLCESAENNGSLGTNSASRDWTSLCHDSGAKELVLKELQKTAKQLSMQPAEVVKGVILSDFEWLPDTMLVTAAMKLRRREVESKYKEEIEALYASLSK